jgi:hypothetical protein
MRSKQRTSPQYSLLESKLILLGDEFSKENKYFELRAKLPS